MGISEEVIESTEGGKFIINQLLNKSKQSYDFMLKSS
jgi:hypothetical protein